ncbi:B12-binding domain-containing radical SAM protein [Holophaga foetida]|uniref:B12-binding domain-containing radical SAM protein n=1 Tax=Holophaga foetida TaxID=35839 RepID=UPI0002473ECC|nr:B12-binding domain-containing radical SAM protein [Holophaga foetida]
MPIEALLIYPRVPPTYWSMKYAVPFLGRRSAFPPLGLLTVAAMLPKDWNLRLVDLNIEEMDESAVATADLVLTSSMLIQSESLNEIIALCNHCGVPVVAGGPHPTASWRQIKGVDHFILNEAEVTLAAFLEDYQQGCPKPVYQSDEKADLTCTPPPRWDLVKPHQYAAMALQFSRGCPHACEFCDITALFGHRPRCKTPAQFLAECEGLYTMGWRGSLFVVDDNFIGNSRAVKTLLAELELWQKAHDYPFTLFTEASLLLAEDEELLDLMVAAGFNMVFLGIETPDAETLAAIGKRQNLRTDLVAAVRRIQDKGMEVTAGFIVGFDGDQTDIFDRQLRFIQQAAIPTAMMGLLTALPGTQLHHRLEEEGRILSISGGDNTHDLSLNFEPRMDRATLLAGYKRVLMELYTPSHYFARCQELLKRLKVHRNSSRHIGLPEVRACLRSLLIQGFSRYSLAYWSFLLRSLLRKPRMATEIVTMAVKGHHYFKVTRAMVELDRFKRGLERVRHALESHSGQAYRERALAHLRRRCNRIDKDFRTYAEAALLELRTTTHARQS